MARTKSTSSCESETGSWRCVPDPAGATRPSRSCIHVCRTRTAAANPAQLQEIREHIPTIVGTNRRSVCGAISSSLRLRDDVSVSAPLRSAEADVRGGGDPCSER
eukprot:2411888-Pyramimonas_sp.AAC.1